MSKKLAVITGVTSGIGLALCRTLLGNHFKVWGLGRNSEHLSRLGRELGEDFHPFTVDLAHASTRHDAFAALQAELPQVDVLVNNAGRCSYETPLNMAVQSWSELFETNVTAGLELCQTLAAALCASPGGHIINISSVTARFVANARFAAYATSKVALERLTEALRMELSPRGIKVTLIAPGLTDTPIYDKVSGFERAKAKLTEQIPTWLTPDDVANTALWVLKQPPHVLVSEVVMMPLGQDR